MRSDSGFYRVMTVELTWPTAAAWVFTIALVTLEVILWTN